MPTTHRKLPPVGSNMNDASYPFRGPYKLDERLNHGHSGVTRLTPTSMAMRITGSNLVIEQLRVPAEQNLSCELGIDGGVPRKVLLDGVQNSSLVVPGDGHDYNLLALVKGSGGRHYCRMTFNGSEGTSVLRLRAPDNCGPEVVHLVADGRRLQPEGGWYSVPVRTNECDIVVRLPPTSAPPTAARAPVVEPGPCPLTLETVPGYAAEAKLVSPETGAEIALTPYGRTTVPVRRDGSSVYRLQLPSPPLPTVSGVATAATPATTTTGEAPAAAMAVVVPELETRIQPDSSAISGAATTQGRPQTFIATAKGFYVQLSAQDGTMVSGRDSATLPLRPSAQEQSVRITVSEATTGRVVLRQTSHVPAPPSPPPPVTLRWQRVADEKRPRLFARDSAIFSMNGGATVVQGPSGVALDRTFGPHIAVEQRNENGTVSSAVFDVSAADDAPHESEATAAAGAAMPQDDAWLTQLASALRAPSAEEANRLVQLISVPTTGDARAATVVDFAKEQLGRPVPVISLAAQGDALSDVQCPGYEVAVAVGHEPARRVGASERSTTMPLAAAGGNAALTVLNARNGRPVARCLVQLLQPATSSLPVAPPSAPALPLSPGANAALELVGRLVECLQRNGGQPARVVDELGRFAVGGSEATLRQLPPLLADCLRRAMAPAVARSVAEKLEQIYVTCGNGYLDDIHTAQPHYQLTATVDQQAPTLVPQHGRLSLATVAQRGDASVTATPPPQHFVHLTAKDTTTGEQKGELRLTLCGPVGAAPSPAPAVPTLQPGTPRAVGDDDSSSLAKGAAAEGQVPPQSSQSLPYLDVALQRVGPETLVHLLCPPMLRIVCDVDGVGGETGRADYVTRMPAARAHRVALSLVNLQGGVVFQQKLDIPALTLSSAAVAASTTTTVWGIALQSSGLAVDPDRGCYVAVATDRGPERVLADGFVPLDANEAHHIVLRKYASDGAVSQAGVDVNGGTSGSLAPALSEVGLRLPGWVDLELVTQLTRLYRSRAAGQLRDEDLRGTLQTMRSSLPRASGPVHALLTALIDALVAARSLPASRAGPSQSRVTSSDDQSRVYFRLTGSD